MLELDPLWTGPLEDEMASYSVFLPGKSHGQRSCVGYGPWGLKESDMTEHVYTCKLSYNTKSIQPPSCFGQQWNNLVTLSCGLKKDFSLRLITMQTFHVISELHSWLNHKCACCAEAVPRCPKWTQSWREQWVCQPCFWRVPAIWPQPLKPTSVKILKPLAVSFCHNKLLHSWWLKIAKMYSFVMLELRRPREVSLG